MPTFFPPIFSELLSWSKHRCILMHHGSRLQFPKIQCLSQFRGHLLKNHISIQKMCGFVVVGFTISRIYCIYIIYIYIISIKHYPQKKKLPKRDSQIENLAILLMVQKSSNHLLRLIVFPHYYKVLYKTPVVFSPDF